MTLGLYRNGSARAKLCFRELPNTTSRQCLRSSFDRAVRRKPLARQLDAPRLWVFKTRRSEQLCTETQAGRKSADDGRCGGEG